MGSRRPGSGSVVTQERAAHKKVVRIEQDISLQALAAKMGVKAGEVLMKLMSLGVSGVNINSSLDSDTAKIVGEEFGWTIEDVAVSEDQAIAMAAMFLSEHIGVRAIVAMTESGGTARFLSRFRSNAPVYAFSRHPGARRRMRLMRDVFAFDYDSRGQTPREAARGSIGRLVEHGLLSPGERIVFTSGEHMETHGATNTLRLLQVGEEGRAEGLGEL